MYTRTSHPEPSHIHEDERVSDADQPPKPPRSDVNRPVDVFLNIDMHDGDSTVCWEWKGKLKRGNRGELRPVMKIRGKDYYAYRLVYEQYTGHALAPGEVVRHTCDNTKCCSPFHLVVGTQMDNVADMVKRERVGMKHYHVKKIMEMLELGCSTKYISNKMKSKYELEMHDSVIRRIRMRKLYKYVEWPWGDAYAQKFAIRKAQLASDPQSDIIHEVEGEKDA